MAAAAATVTGMSAEESKWIEEALKKCVDAKAKGALILLVRRRDHEGESDIAITNVDEEWGAMVNALTAAIQGS